MITKQIDIADFTDGMTLAEPIKNRNGQILLNKDVVLDKKHIMLLKTWGIKKLHIYAEGEGLEEQIPEPLDNLDLVDSRINWKPRNSFENELIKLAINYNEKDTS